MVIERRCSTAALNPVFILGLGPFPAMGIAGSAVATLIANAIAVIALISYIYRRDLPIRLRGHELHYLRPEAALAWTIVRQGRADGRADDRHVDRRA